MGGVPPKQGAAGESRMNSMPLPGERPSEPTEALIERCLTGDVVAFERLVKQHHPQVYAYASRMVGLEAAQDVTQDVFLRVYRALHTYRGDGSFSTWLYRITYNVCIDYRRRAQRELARSVSLDGQYGPDEPSAAQLLPDAAAVNPAERAEEKELEEALHRALMRLSDKHRAVLVLHDMHGFRYDEIKKIVGCSLGTVKSRLYYARRALREELRPFLERAEGMARSAETASSS